MEAQKAIEIVLERDAVESRIGRLIASGRDTRKPPIRVECTQRRNSP